MTKLVQLAIRRAILPVFAGANRSFTSRHQATTPCILQPIPSTCSHYREITYNYICSIAGDKVEPASTITVQMATHSRTASVTVLSDSGADISAAGQAILGILGHHLDNLTLSEISPRAVNEARMKPLGKIATNHHPSTRKDLLIKMKSFQECHRHSFHRKLLKSWAYCPLVSTSREIPQVMQNLKVHTNDTMDYGTSIIEQLIQEFLSIFSGQVSPMEGDLFTISLRENAEPNSPLNSFH